MCAVSKVSFNISFLHEGLRVIRPVPLERTKEAQEISQYFPVLEHVVKTTGSLAIDAKVFGKCLGDEQLEAFLDKIPHSPGIFINIARGEPLRDDITDYSILSANQKKMAKPDKGSRTMGRGPFS